MISVCNCFAHCSMQLHVYVKAHGHISVRIEGFSEKPLISMHAFLLTSRYFNALYFCSTILISFSHANLQASFFDYRCLPSPACYYNTDVKLKLILFFPAKKVDTLKVYCCNRLVVLLRPVKFCDSSRLVKTCNSHAINYSDWFSCPF